MGSEMELQQVIYHIFVTQIEFGTYRLGDRLPTIEEAGQLLFVSPDTVRSDKNLPSGTSYMVPFPFPTPILRKYPHTGFPAPASFSPFSLFPEPLYTRTGRIRQKLLSEEGSVSREAPVPCTSFPLPWPWWWFRT